MISESRYVVDTNTLVSALLFERSRPGQAFFTARQLGQILLSRTLFTELQTVLSRKKFDRYILPDERERFLATLLLEAMLIDVSVHIQACRDPKDDYILELAVEGNATCIITGDLDLLELSPFQSIPILTPANFLEVVSTPS